MSSAACNHSLPSKKTVLFGERPASWRRRGLIRPVRAQHRCEGSIPPALRLTLQASPGGSQEAFPDPFRRGDTSAWRGRFNSCPAFIIHAKVALGVWPVAGRPLLGLVVFMLHHSIWAPKKFSIPHFVGVQKDLDSVECTQQLGVTAQQKNPELARQGQHGANNNPAAKRQNAASHLHSCTVSCPSQRESTVANVLKREKQLQVIHLLVEGNSLRSIERLTGVQKKTVGRLLLRIGNACRELLDERMRDLTLQHVQVDEIWTFVQKKQSRLTTLERAYRGDIGDMFLWVPLDTDTKLIPTFAVGKRSADMARRLMVDLRGRLVRKSYKPHDSDAHAYKPGGYEPITQISTDGFTPYPEAVDLAFGPNVKYGTIIKEYRNAVRPYTPSEIVGTAPPGRPGHKREPRAFDMHVARRAQ